MKSNINIYVVDDEPLSVETMKRLILKVKPDARILSFSDPEEVIGRLGNTLDKPDIVFFIIDTIKLHIIEYTFIVTYKNIHTTKLK